jgi:hypothetical protein
VYGQCSRSRRHVGFTHIFPNLLITFLLPGSWPCSILISLSTLSLRNNMAVTFIVLIFLLTWIAYGVPISPSAANIESELLAALVLRVFATSPAQYQQHYTELRYADYEYLPPSLTSALQIVVAPSSTSTLSTVPVPLPTTELMQPRQPETTPKIESEREKDEMEKEAHGCITL